MTYTVMQITPQQLKPQGNGLVGDYGDVFWDLPPSLSYAAGSEVFCRVYVANPTDADREYMLMAAVSRDGVIVNEFPIKVDDAVWFSVEAESVVALPGALKVEQSDAILTLNLYERELNGIANSVSTALVTAAAAGLPILPGLPGIQTDITGGFMDTMMMVMLVVMMGVMMTKSVDKK